MKGGKLLKYYTGHYQKEVFEKSTKTYSCCTDRQSSGFYLSVNEPQHIVILSCVWHFYLVTLQEYILKEFSSIPFAQFLMMQCVCFLSLCY